MRIQSVNKRLLCTSSLLAMALAAPLAQAAEEAGIEEIVVTGSRIARRDLVATSPLVTVTTEELRTTGAVNLDVALGQLPEFNITNSSASGFQGSGQLSGSGGGSPATVNLRGLGAQRNLVLLDGRRLPFANALGTVDISTIPPSVIGTVESITGGASAVYGSDALSGVVNFRTRDYFIGTEVSGQYGVSEHGDAQNAEVSVVTGREYLGGKGKFILAGSYSRRGPLLRSDRLEDLQAFNSPFLSDGLTSIASSAAAVNTVFAKYGIAPGTVTPASPIGFNSDGTLFAVNGGANLRRSPKDIFPIKLVSNVLTESIDKVVNIIYPQDRYSAFIKTNYEISDHVTAYAQAIFTRNEEVLPIAVNQGNGLVVPVTNPFIPADLKTLLASRSNPNATFTITKTFLGLSRRDQFNSQDTYQLVGGLRGRLDFGDINWDVYYAYSASRLDSTQVGIFLNSRMAAVLLAPDGGASLCQGGFNIFGHEQSSGASADCVDYLSTTGYYQTNTSQSVFEGTFNGALFDFGGDKVRYSVTGTYRQDGLEFLPDPRNRPAGTPDPTGQNVIAADFMFGFPVARFPFRTITIGEFAGELLIPIFRDKPFGDSLNINVGGRYSDYSTAGGIGAYRVESDYRINPSLMLRGGYEHAVRAANFGEALNPATGTAIFLNSPPAGGDPCDYRTNARIAGGAALRTLCLATGVPASAIDNVPLTITGQGTQVGNPNLAPEAGDTFTIGTVVTPKFGPWWLQDVSLTLDYYNINIDKIITSVTANNTIFGCYNTNGVTNPTYDPNNVLCKNVSRAADGNLIGVITQPQNLGGLETQGLDAQLNWSVPLENGDRIRIGASANYLLEYAFKATPAAALVDYSGYFSDPFVGDQHPRFKTNVTLGYSTSVWNSSLTWRYIPSMHDLTQLTAPTVALRDTGDYSVFDLTGSYKIDERFTFSAGINNLFDISPRHTAKQEGVVVTRLYDVIGRRFYVGFKASF